MQVPHNAFVLVVDGRKSLFFRNEGDAEHPNLKVEHAEEHVNPRDGEQKTDAAGSARSTQSGAGAPPIALSVARFRLLAVHLVAFIRSSDDAVVLRTSVCPPATSDAAARKLLPSST